MLLRYRRIKGVREACALASLLGSFRAVDCLLWRLKTELLETRNSKSALSRNILQIVDKYHTGLAGGLAVLPPMLISKTSILNSTMIFWLIVRAERSLLPSIPYAEIFIMCVSAIQILPTWLYAPKELSSSYVKFLTVQAAKPKSLLRDLKRGNVTSFCDAVHPGVSCTSHAFDYFVAGLRRALPVYIPIHILGFLFSKRKDPIIGVVNLARSTTFLSLYCTLAWFSACLTTRMFPGVTRLKFASCQWVPGLALIIEKEGRRKELAAYCLTHAFDSVYLYLKRRKYVQPKDWFSCLAAVWAFAVIMQHHHHQPDFIARLLFGIGMKKVMPVPIEE